VKAQAQRVQMAEGRNRQLARRILPDAFEHHIAQIVEQHPGKARPGIGKHQPDRERHALFHPRHHRVNRGTVEEAHRQLHALRDEHDEPRKGDADLVLALPRWPQIGQEPPQRRQDGRLA